MITLEFTKDDCRNLADFIDSNLIAEIRKDDNLDNIAWIRSMINCLDKFADAADMHGFY